MIDPTVARAAWLCGGALVLGAAAVRFTHSAEIRSRWLVWSVAAPIVLGAALLPHGMLTLAAAFAFLAAWELARLLPGSRRSAVLTGSLAPIALALLPDGRTLILTGLLAISLPGVVLFLRHPRPAWNPAGTLGVSSAFVGFPLGLLASEPAGRVVAVLVTVSFADVGGYVIGRALRRYTWSARPISRWSPNKTRGGLLGSLVVGAVVLAYFGMWWLIPLVPLWGVLGDLRESRLKRLAGVKDAAGWLPGFGGLLDRIDSTLGAMVGVALTQVLVALA